MDDNLIGELWHDAWLSFSCGSQRGLTVHSIIDRVELP